MDTPDITDPSRDSQSNEGSLDAEGLARRYASMRGLVAQLLGAESMGQDAQQDVILAALTRPPRIERGFSAWFGGAVRRRRLHLRRGHGLRRTHELRAVEGRAAGSPVEPHAAVVRAETHERLVAAVMALPEPYRTPIVLRYLDEYDTREVADELGRPVSTIQTQLQRGLALLRERLREEGRRHGEDWSSALSILLIPRPASIRRRIESAARVQGLASGGVSGWLLAGGLVTGALLVGVLALTRSSGSQPPGQASVDTRALVPEVSGDVGPKEHDHSLGVRTAGTAIVQHPPSVAESTTAPIRIEVTRAIDGSALTSAVAYIDSARDLTASATADPADRARARTADEVGLVLLTPPGSDGVWVRVEAEGHIGALVRVDDRSSRIPVQLAVAAELRVEAGDGVTLRAAGAWPVTSFPIAARPFELQGAESGSGADPSGSLSAWLAPGSYVVSAMVERGGEQYIDSALIGLTAGESVTWRALDPGESDLLVKLARGHGGAEEWSAMLLLGDTGQPSTLTAGSTDDALRLRSVPPGRHQLLVRIGQTALPRQTVLVGRGPTPVEHVVELPTGRLLLTVERFDESEPDPLILLVGPLGLDACTPRKFAASGHEVTFDALDPGLYEAWTRSPSGVGRSELIVVDGDNTLALERENGASARFTYTGSPPIDAHEVVLVTSSGVRLPLTYGLEAGAAAAFGAASIPGELRPGDGSLTFAVPPGDYVLEVAVDGQSRAPRALALVSGGALEFGPGPPLPPVTLVLTRHGRPVAHQLVELAGHLPGASPLDASRGPLWMLSGVTSATGRWSTPLSPANWTATLVGGETVSFESTPTTTLLRLELGVTDR